MNTEPTEHLKPHPVLFKDENLIKRTFVQLIVFNFPTSTILCSKKKKKTIFV